MEVHSPSPASDRSLGCVISSVQTSEPRIKTIAFPWGLVTISLEVRSLMGGKSQSFHQHVLVQQFVFRQHQSEYDDYP
ncbi:MAG: hypothetical protein ACO31I_10190 [Prochlorotrichaceae cyanobacterium]